MRLQIDRPFIEAMMMQFPHLTSLTDQLRFSEKVEIPFESLSDVELSFLIGLYQKAGPALQARAAQLLTLRNALANQAKRFREEELEQFLPALSRYLVDNGSRGWLFTVNFSTRPLPYVITRLDYTPPTNEEAGRVFIEMKANAKGSIVANVIRISASDIIGKTVGDILAEKGFIKETPELLAAYDDAAERYYQWRSLYGIQFSGKGVGFYAADPNSSRRDMDWSKKDLLVLSTNGGTARLVNDESILTSRSLTLDVPGDVLGAYLRRAAKSNEFEAEKEVEESKATIPKGMFCKIPVHTYILMFHLELHHYLWVHVDELTLYEYKPALKQKLILPPEQTDLIDILTAEMDVLMDDIVAGKSGGTTVLCAGPPGVGKTLTAEVYSEIIKRPLYRVHSGQLGLDVSSMEAALQEVLTRAQRWGAVMLIDEADVYIRRRNDNMVSNAVVGVFLRVLEYFNGLLFLTTNRAADIDEAIVSRCIALIKYEPPEADARRKIWQVMAEQFSLAMTQSLLNQLVEIFPSATGRDIKGLSKLVAKYCHQKKVGLSLEVFKRCAIFRGLDVQRG